MPRQAVFVCSLCVCLSLALPAAASLFSDDSEDESHGDALNAADWRVLETTAEVSVSVRTVSADNRAAFEFTASAASTDTARAWTRNTWRIDNDGPLTWTIDFQMAAGTRSTTVVPFVFDTDWNDESATSNKYYKNTDMNVTVIYADNGAVANISLFNIPMVSFRDGGNNLFAPGPSDDTIYTLTLTLDDTNVIGDIRARDEVNPTVYTAQISHGLTLSTPAHLGMQVHNLNGADAKTVRYDNVLLMPEPATLALLAVGGLVVARGRRRRL